MPQKLTLEEISARLNAAIGAETARLEVHKTITSREGGYSPIYASLKPTLEIAQMTLQFVTSLAGAIQDSLTTIGEHHNALVSRVDYLESRVAELEKSCNKSS